MRFSTFYTLFLAAGLAVCNPLVAQNVGIGTAAPAFKLDVVGNGRFTTDVYWGANRGQLTTDQGASIELGGTGQPYVDFSNDGAADYDMRLILRGDDVLDVEGGNLGVNILAPTTRLHIDGEARIGSSGMTAAAAGAGALRWDGTNVLYSNGAAWSNLGGGWGLTGNAGTTAGTNFIGTTDAVRFDIRTGNVIRASVDAVGNVGIGTTVAGNNLTVANAVLPSVRIGYSTSFNNVESGRLIFEEFSNNYNGTTNCGFQFHHDGNANTLNLSSYCTALQANIVTFTRNGRIGVGLNAPAYQFELSTNSAGKPGTNTWTVTSDARTKRNIRPYEAGLADLRRIRPVWFEYNGQFGTPAGEQYVGVIAQDLQTVAPYMVRTVQSAESPATADGQAASTSNAAAPLLGVDNGAMTYMLINAVNEQQQMIETQQRQIQEQQRQIDELRQMLQNNSNR